MVKTSFFQLDAPASQLKEQYSIAKTAGFRLITTLKEGSSERGLVELLRQISESECLQDCVFILDTVKKFTDINFKPAATAFYEICRAITRRGGTVLSLAHTNKYSDDGLLIPEGVGDLRNDCDNLAMIYRSAKTWRCRSRATQTSGYGSNKSRRRSMTNRSYLYS